MPELPEAAAQTLTQTYQTTQDPEKPDDTCGSLRYVRSGTRFAGAGPGHASQEVGKSFYDVVKPDDLKDYCIFRNEAYSIGSFSCEGRQANVCAAPSDPPPPGTNNMGRAYWKPQKADQACAQ